MKRVALALLISPIISINAQVRELRCWQSYLSEQEFAGFSGAVLLGQGENVVLEKEYGRASTEGRPTAFWIASISKAITATAILKLVDDGLLDLNAPLSKYVPDLSEPLANLTAHHLLSHRSGLPHAYASDGILDRAAAVRAIGQLKLEKKPGDFLYSNDGYSLLAILIETISGEQFENYIRRQIFKPAGMDGAGFWGFESGKSSVAAPFNPLRTDNANRNVWHNGHSIANWGFRGPTGIYATAKDLFKFARALATGRLLKPTTFQMMISSKNPSLGPTAQTYGYGLALRFKDGRLTEYFHAGNEDWLGHNAVLSIIGDRTYVILTNSGESGKQSWAHRVEEGLHLCEK